MTEGKERFRDGNEDLTKVRRRGRRFDLPKSGAKEGVLDLMGRGDRVILKSEKGKKKAGAYERRGV